MNAPGHRRPRRLKPADLMMGRTGASLVRRLPAARFHKVLDRIDAGLLTGSLEAHLPDGTTRLLGGRAEGPAAVVNLRGWQALIRLGLGGSVGWFRAWMKREWDSPDPVALFALFMGGVYAIGFGQVALGGRSIGAALGDGLGGTLKNVLPIVLLAVLAVVAMIALGLVVGIVGGILALVGGLVHKALGMLLLMPVYIGMLLVVYVVMFGVMYFMWRDICGEAPAAEAPRDDRIEL